MRTDRHFGIIPAIAMALFTACSTTRNLPEDEILYRGIKKLNYGAQTLQKENEDGEGVIKAIADAYDTVEGILTGNASKTEVRSDEEIRDSLRKVNKTDTKAYEKAKDEVEGVLSYAPNAALMGSSYIRHPFPARLWIYNKYVNSKRRFGKWMFRQFAATPVYVSTVNPKVRIVVAQNTLRNYGYLRGTVSHDTVPTRNPRAVKLSYNVTPGTLFHIDSIAYMNFPFRADSIIRATMGDSKLYRGKPFSVADLDAERERIAGNMRNNGYYYFRPGYITYRADTLIVPDKVQLQVIPSSTTPGLAKKQYYIGDTKICVMEYGNYNVTDTLRRGRTTYTYSGGTPSKPPLRLPSIRRFILFRPGDMYHQKIEDISTELISSMGIFSSMHIDFVPRDSTESADTLDMVVTAMLDKPYDTEFQGNVTSKSNGQIGPGASFSMYKHNAFRGAETLGLKVWGSYEWQTGANLHGKRSLINSYEYGASLLLSYPRLLTFGLGQKHFRRALTSTDIAMEAKWMNRANYFGRVSLSASLTYNMQKRRNVKHEFTPLSLTYEQLLHSTAKFDSIVSQNQALYVSMRDQFVPAMEYTFSWAASKGNPRTLKVNVKEAGAVTSALYAIGGKRFTESGKTLFGVPFAQFIKGSVQYTYQLPLTRRSCLASRIFGGVVYSYGNAIAAPLNDLFSVGGANSIRAFAVRSIGPGAYHPATTEYSYIDQMGDIKLEANIEYRFPIVANLYGATFIDAGNVWQIRNGSTQPGGKFRISDFGDQIALGTGAGLRYDLDFLVLRFDVGVGLHAPYDTGKSGYYNMPSFGKSLGYHFAIGYPF